LGRPKCVGDLKEVMASVSAPTSLTRILFILSSLSVSTVTDLNRSVEKQFRNCGHGLGRETYSIFAVR
jgi:hypothetical protein